ncbi:MAG: hypothetical protein V9G19_08215 [Tetrasphaera sp.]
MTTLLETIIGLVRQTRGSITLDGLDLAGRPTHPDRPGPNRDRPPGPPCLRVAHRAQQPAHRRVSPESGPSSASMT